MIFFSAVVLVSLAVVVKAIEDPYQFLQGVKVHESCDLWAQNDNECINNPRFMWSGCAGSCLSFAVNQDERCESWGNEGECSANPGYIQVHCPRSCSNAIAWNPWVRRELNIDPIPMEHNLGQDEIQQPKNLFEVSEVMRLRVKKFLAGLSSVVQGMSSDAPTEFLGMLGLAEAILYTMRLQEIIFEYVSLTDELNGHRGHIGAVLEVLKQGYASDPILRSLPLWTQIIDEAAIRLHTLFDSKASDELLEGDGDRNARELPYDLSIDRLASTFFNQDSGRYDDSLPASKQINNTVTLSNGVLMPIMGLGTWQLDGDVCYQGVIDAVKNGYRLIDTAEAYRNEDRVGDAIRQLIADKVVERKDLFIATKLSDPDNAGFDKTKRLILRQLEDLKTDYIDLYMLHSPIQDPRLQRASWRAMEEMYDRGVLKAIGVSNFDSRELEELIHNSRIKPMVVQNKLDIYHIGKQLDNRGDNIVTFAAKNQIVLLAYSPFSAYPFVMEPVADPIVNFLAHRRSQLSGTTVTAAQMILKWIAQRGIASIPRSSNPVRQLENLHALDLLPLDGHELTLLDIAQLLIGSPVAVPAQLTRVA